MKKQRIVAVHLLNDFSGSPFVLRQSLEALIKANYEVQLFTSTSTESKGFLSDISGVKATNIFYKWNKNKLVTLCLFLWSQLSLFVQLLFNLKKNDIVYINSLLPFGAAIAAKFRGCKVFYHIHEVSIKPALLKKFLLSIANVTANAGVFVSNDLQQRTKFNKSSSVVYNALPDTFIQTALQYAGKRNTYQFSILMLCSMKQYKGVFEFIECARWLPLFQFKLVLNTTEHAITEYFKEEKLPENLQLFPAQQNVHPFYQQADVVMNLSRPDEWVETFGMTILEAMYYKKPVIVPPVGGIAELVTDGVEGYLIDSVNINMICKKLQGMAASPSFYQMLSTNAFKKAHQFTQSHFSQNIQRNISALSVESKVSKRHHIPQIALFK